MDGLPSYLVRAVLSAASRDIAVDGWSPHPSCRSLLAILIFRELELTDMAGGIGCAGTVVTQAARAAGFRNLGDYELAPGRTAVNMRELLRAAEALLPKEDRPTSLG